MSAQMRCVYVRGDVLPALPRQCPFDANMHVGNLLYA